MTRIRKFVEVGLLASFWPCLGVSLTYFGYKVMMWSYGGREVFRFAVIQQPLEQNWMNVTPKVLLQREAPLSEVPKRLETYGHGDAGEEHPHSKNY